MPGELTFLSKPQQFSTLTAHQNHYGELQKIQVTGTCPGHVELGMRPVGSVAVSFESSSSDFFFLNTALAANPCSMSQHNYGRQCNPNGCGPKG